MKPILLFENQWCPWKIGSSTREAEDASRLLVARGRELKIQLGLRIEPFSCRSHRGNFEIKASGIAGTLSAGPYVIDVVPKIINQTSDATHWFESTLLLVQYARRKDSVFTRAHRLKASRHSFVDTLAMAFRDAVEVGLSDQLIHMYSTSEKQLPVLRGRLNYPRQFRSLYVRPHILECDVDQLDAANKFNGFLKWAAITFGYTVRDSDLKKSMLEIASRFPGIPSRSLALQGRIEPPPQFRTWTQALDIAFLLSSGLTHISGSGSYRGYSFVFNMEKLFEHFVEVVLARAVLPWGDGYATVSQRTALYAKPYRSTSFSFYSRPDNLLLRKSSPLVVVDAKYKRLSDELATQSKKPGNPDVYELVSAMTAHRCRLGLLIYPMISGDTVLKDEGLRIWIVNAFQKDLLIGAVALDLAKLRTSGDMTLVSNVMATALRTLLSEGSVDNDFTPRSLSNIN